MEATIEEIFNSLIDIAKDYVPEGQEVHFTMDSPISSESGIDSMSFIVIVTRIEVLYNIKISNHAMNKMHTLKDVVDYIQKKVN